LTGVFEVLHIMIEEDMRGDAGKDYHDGVHNPSVHELYSLNVNGNYIDVYSLNHDLSYLSQSQVTLRGLLIDDVLVVDSVSDSYTILSEPSIDFGIKSDFDTMYRKTAVILINFADRPNAFLKPISELREDIFTGNLSSNEYVREVSFDMFALTGHNNVDGDFFGWYVLSENASICRYTNFRRLANAARAAAEEDGFDHTKYQHIIYLYPPSNCGYGGLGMVGGRETWINGYNNKVINHELGHNFGFGHAGTYRCFDEEGVRVTLSDNCTRTIYLDPYDIMGTTEFIGILIIFTSRDFGFLKIILKQLMNPEFTF
jgi:hypothetical protein